MKNITILILLLSASLLFGQKTTTELGNVNNSQKLYNKIKTDETEKPKSNNRSSICFDGENLISFYYQGQGSFELVSKDLANRKFIKEDKINSVVCESVGRHCSPGGSTIVNNKLWISDAYGKQLSSINLESFSIEKQFTFDFEGKGSKSIGGVAHDGKHIWLAVHINDYSQATEKTQLLLKITPDTGSELDRYPLPPSDKKIGINALTWNGENLVYFKSNTIYFLSNKTGQIISKEKIDNIGKVGGITYAEGEIYIQKFNGEILKYNKASNNR